MIYNIDSTQNSMKKDDLKLFKTESLAREFTASRSALKKCLFSLGQVNSESLILPDDIKLLEVTNHCFLKNFSNLLVSIAHTKQAGVAVIISKESHLSVGIDIEHNNRKVTPEIINKFQNRWDQPCNNILDLWVKKEAVFKAIDPIKSRYRLENKSLVLSDIWVKDKNFGILDNSIIIGELFTKYIEFEENEFQVSIASIPKN